MGKEAFETCTPEMAGFPSAAIERFLDRLAACETEPHGVMMLRSGKVFFSAWWHPYGPEIIHGLQSLTKTFSGTAIGLLVTEGKLSLNTKLAALFPECMPKDADPYLQAMTIRDVLCMGTGMETAAPASEHWVEDFFRTPVIHQPGTAFYYNNPGSNMLAKIVHKVTGQSMVDYLENRLFPYVGIKEGSIPCLTLPDGTAIGGGGMFARLEDCVRLMQLYMQGGVAKGKRLLSKEWVNMATSCQNAAPNPQGIRDCQQGYGFQMWMCSFPGAYRADGAMGQYVICFPHLDLIVAIHETASYPTGVQQVLDAVYEMAAKGKDRPLTEDAEAYAHLLHRADSLHCPEPFHDCLSSASADHLAGRYQVSKGTIPWVPAITWLVGGKKYPAIQRLSLEKNTCWKLKMETAEGNYCMVLPVDGSKEETNLPGLFPYDRALVQACITEKDRLEADIRYVQTCYHTHLSFYKSKDQLIIETRMNDLFPVHEHAEAKQLDKE